jgi:dienelactone hydrolase
MRRFLVISLILVTMAVACAGPTPTPSVEPVRVTTAPTPTPLPSTDYLGLGIEGNDGVTLFGAFYAPESSEPRPGVLLIHQLGGQKEDWATFADRLREDGYAVLSLDLRGHGESDGEFEPVDPDLLTDDVLRAWAVLEAQPEVDPARTAIVGADVGANLALRAGAAQPEVQAVVLLSPGLDYRGIETEDAIVDYGDRPVLVVVSEDDAYAAESAGELVALASGRPTFTLYPDAGHGTEMLAARSDLAPLILGWLDSQVGP